MSKKIILIMPATVMVALVNLSEAQQPKKVSRIGYLSSFDAATESAGSKAIRLALRELDYIDGQNVAFEYRYTQERWIGLLSMRPSW